jgi:hypothetical protein
VCDHEYDDEVRNQQNEADETRVVGDADAGHAEGKVPHDDPGYG